MLSTIIYSIFVVAVKYKDHSLKGPAVYKGRFFLDKSFPILQMLILAGFMKAVACYKDHGKKICLWTIFGLFDIFCLKSKSHSIFMLIIHHHNFNYIWEKPIFRMSQFILWRIPQFSPMFIEKENGCCYFKEWLQYIYMMLALS